MKKLICSLLALSMALSLTACGDKAQDSAASENVESSVPAYETAADLLSWSWDDIKAAAKQEGELTFAVWLQESEWNEVARLFEERYGIHVNVMVGEKTLPWTRSSPSSPAPAPLMSCSWPVRPWRA